MWQRLPALQVAATAAENLFGCLGFGRTLLWKHPFQEGWRKVGAEADLVNPPLNFV